MPYVIVRHKVKDLAKWKTLYDAHGETRRRAGSRGAHLFRNVDAPEELVILFEWDDLEKARRFIQSPDLRETMQKAGVVGPPEVCFLEEIERKPA